MKKKELEVEEKWKIDEAIESFKRYKKIIEEKGMKEKIQKEMEKRGKQMIKEAKEI